MTVAAHVPVPALALIGGGHVKAGGSISVTVIRKVQVLVCPAPSVTIHCTVVKPFWNVALLLGLPLTCPVPPLTQVRCPAGRAQLSETVGFA